MAKVKSYRFQMTFNQEAVTDTQDFFQIITSPKRLHIYRKKRIKNTKEAGGKGDREKNQ